MKFLGNIFGFENKKKAKAKEQVKIEVEEMIKKLREEIFSEVNRIIKEVEQEVGKITENFKEFLRKNKEISRNLGEVIDKLRQINYKISIVFLKYLDDNIEFGYIHTSLKEGTKVIIVSKHPENIISKLELIGIKREYIYDFPTLQKLREYLDDKKISEFKKNVYSILNSSAQKES